MTTVQADDYKEFAKNLKAADKKIATETRKELRTLGRDLAEPVLSEGAKPMPHRGGLADWIMARANVRVSITASRLELALGIKKKDLIPRLDSSGRLRRPVWADPTKTRKEWRWRDQQVPQRTWTDAFTARRAEMVESMSRAVEAAARKVTP